MKVKTEHRMEEGRTGMTHVLIEAVEKHLHDGNENQLEGARLAQNGPEGDHGGTGGEVRGDEGRDLEFEILPSSVEDAVPPVAGEH